MWYPNCILLVLGNHIVLSSFCLCLCLCVLSLNIKMGKGSRLRRQKGKNAASANGKDEKKIFESTRDKEKDDQISQPCKRCEDEISKLRELNQRFVKNMDTSRQEEFRKLAEMESQIRIHKVAETNFQSKIDSMASERELLNTEVESLKAQLNEYNARLVQIESEKLQNEKVLQQYRAENIDLQSSMHDLQWKIEYATHLWNAEKSNLESTVTELQTKHELMGSEMGSLTKENRALKSELNDSKKRNQELLQNIEDDRQSWDVKKSNLEDSLAALQTTHDLLAEERRSWTQKNRDMSIEVEFLKCRVNEGLKQQSDLIQQYKVAEQENETLQEEVNRTKSLFEKQNKKFTESIVENGRLNEQVKALSKEFVELQGANVKLMQEKDAQRIEFEALAETARKYTELEENRCESLKQNEEHGKRIEALHEDLMVEQSRNKALEEELLSTKSSLEEIKKSAAAGEVQIANLRSQLSAVEEEKDSKLSDIQKQLLAREEEKKSQLVSLQDQLSFSAAGKKMLEEENKYLQMELYKRTSVSKEEKVRLEASVRELQTTFNSLNKELESSRAITEEKEQQLVDLRNQHSDLVEVKKCLEEKNDCLVTELNKCTMVSEENICLQSRIRELEIAFNSAEKENDSKENHQPLISERHPLPAKPPVNRNGNGKSKPIEKVAETSEIEKSKCVNEKGKPKPNVMTENPTQKQVPQKPTLNPQKQVPQKPTLNPSKQKQNQRSKKII